MKKFTTPTEAVDNLIKKVGKNIILAAPLGAGKANHILNELYLRAKKDACINLTILTALTLQVPEAKSFYEKKFMGPFLKRVFKNYPNLEYEKDRGEEDIDDDGRFLDDLISTSVEGTVRLLQLIIMHHP